MRRFLAACLFMVVVAVAAGPALAQGITWWEHSNPPHNNYSKELVADWNKKNPGSRVQYEFFAMTPYFKKLSAALSTKSAADMFTVLDILLPGFTTKNVLAPIRPGWLGYKDLEDMKAAYLPGALEGYMHQGKLYAVPIISNTFALYLNTDHFREAGLDPDKDYPRTWDDIARVGKKLVKVEGGKMVREAFDFAMHSSVWTMWYMEGLIRQYGGSILDAAGKKCAANSEAGVKAMKVRAMFAHEHKISDPTVSVGTNALPANDLAVGRVSMFITHAGSVAQFGPQVMRHVKAVPFPQVNPDKPVTIVNGFALAVNPHVSEAKQKQVHDLIKHVTQNPKEWYEKTTYPNPKASFATMPGLEEAKKSHYLDIFIKSLETGNFVTRSPHFIEISDAMHRAMERVVLKGEDSKKSLDQACKEVDAALAKK
ncbi:MAG: extracellular solute-binding protein [Candidatus Tectomicrobia bacterium]|nr:extracellular solute-binding protein [Candidatus Tectomicrobia bacterium]